MLQTTMCLNPLLKLGAVKPLRRHIMTQRSRLNPLLKLGAVKQHVAGLRQAPICLNPLLKLGAVKRFYAVSQLYRLVSIPF